MCFAAKVRGWDLSSGEARSRSTPLVEGVWRESQQEMAFAVILISLGLIAVVGPRKPHRMTAAVGANAQQPVGLSRVAVQTDCRPGCWLRKVRARLVAPHFDKDHDNDLLSLPCSSSVFRGQSIRRAGLRQPLPLFSLLRADPLLPEFCP